MVVMELSLCVSMIIVFVPTTCHEKDVHAQDMSRRCMTMSLTHAVHIYVLLHIIRIKRKVQLLLLSCCRDLAWCWLFGGGGFGVAM